MLFTGKLALLGLLLSTAQAASISDDAPIVDLGYAKYRGVNNKTTGLTTFLGIHFAAPPTGSLRFRAPQPPKPTSGILDATQFGPQCFQTGFGNALTNPFRESNPKRSIVRRDIGTSEDCLVLNVYSPPQAAAKKKKLPVVFWIHGGGYVLGNGAMFPGEDLVHNANDEIVTVIIQYRLGVFGFLPGAAVKENGDLNAGLLDQQFALQWVQKYVHLFGGDPNQVTIWGESAGAGSVLQHMIAHGGNTQPSLFKRAMTSSTYLPPQYRFNDRIPEAVFAKTAQMTNCTDAKNVVDCLRATDIDVIQTANENIDGEDFFGLFQYVPVVDGTLIQDSPVATITRGRLNGELLLAMTNTFEGSLFVSNLTTNGTINDYIANTIPTLSNANVERAAKIYSNIPGLPDVNSQAIAVQGEVIFICPTYYLLKALGTRGHKGEFAIPPGRHGQDISYYFITAPEPQGPPAFNNTIFLRGFSGAFADVTVLGDVNKHIFADNKTPNWPTWVQGHTEMLFNVTEDFTTPIIHTVTTDPKLLDRCAFWKSLAPEIGQ